MLAGALSGHDHPAPHDETAAVPASVKVAAIRTAEIDDVNHGRKRRGNHSIMKAATIDRSNVDAPKSESAAPKRWKKSLNTPTAQFQFRLRPGVFQFTFILCRSNISPRGDSDGLLHQFVPSYTPH